MELWNQSKMSFYVEEGLGEEQNFNLPTKSHRLYIYKVHWSSYDVRVKNLRCLETEEHPLTECLKYRSITHLGPTSRKALKVSSCSRRLVPSCSLTIFLNSESIWQIAVVPETLKDLLQCFIYLIIYSAFLLHQLHFPQSLQSSYPI